MQFRPHLPAFVETRRSDAVPIYEVETLADVLKIEHVQRFSSQRGFSHFARTLNRLIAVLDDGFEWWVVGSVSDRAVLETLPIWESKYRALLDGVECVLTGKQVVSSCGDTLELADGRTATNLRKD